MATIDLEPVVSLKNVSQRYGKAVALDSISIDIPAQMMIGLIGPDGVGKSTLLGIVAGVRMMQSGQARVLGGDIGDAGFRNRASSRIAYLPQGLGKNLYPTLSIFENADFFGRLFGQSREEREYRINDLFASTDLSAFRDRPAGKLSGGMKQKLGLCCSLIHDPDLLILDEPTTGVDPLARRQFWELIARIRLRRPTMSVLVATAYMDEAEGFDWLAAMNDGKVLATGTPEELRRSTNETTLERAFIKLLPEEATRGHREPVITPWKSSGDTPAIEAEGLTQQFGTFTAVDHVSFRIERGEIFGFLGSNGCGKTTTMKMLTGLLPPTSGTALLFGKAVKGGDVDSRRHVGFMTQAFSLYTELTVRQNLILHARLFDIPEEKGHLRVDELLKSFALEPVADTLAESLPLGIRQRLSLAVAVIHEPEMLILDEPTSGVDPVARDGFWELLIRLSRENGVTIFLSTHFMNEAERCDRMSMMHAGKVLAQGPPAQLVAERKAKNLEAAFIGYLEEAAAKTAATAAPAADAAATDAAATDAPVTAHSDEPSRFSVGRVWAFARREAVELWHDKVRVSFAVFGPILLMVVFGYGISLDVDHLPFAVLDSDGTAASRLYTDSFRGSYYFEEKASLNNYDELNRRLRNGELRIALEIPSGFQKDLSHGSVPVVNAIIDAAVPFPWRDGTRIRRGHPRPLPAESAQGAEPATTQQSDKGGSPGPVQSGFQEYLRHGSGRHHAAAHADSQHADGAERGAGKGARIHCELLCGPCGPTGISARQTATLSHRRTGRVCDARGPRTPAVPGAAERKSAHAAGRGCRLCFGDHGFRTADLRLLEQPDGRNIRRGNHCDSSRRAVFRHVRARLFPLRRRMAGWKDIPEHVFSGHQRGHLHQGARVRLAVAQRAVAGDPDTGLLRFLGPAAEEAGEIVGEESPPCHTARNQGADESRSGPGAAVSHRVFLHILGVHARKKCGHGRHQRLSGGGGRG